MSYVEMSREITNQIRAIDRFAFGDWGVRGINIPYADACAIQFRGSSAVKNKNLLEIKLNEGMDLYEIYEFVPKREGGVNPFTGKKMRHVTGYDKVLRFDSVFAEDLVRFVDHIILGKSL